MIKAQVSKFIVIGIIATILNYSVFYVLFTLFNLNYLVSASIGFFSGVILGYSLNKTWTFNVTESHNSYIVKYLTVYSFSLVTGMWLLHFLVEVMHGIPELSNIAIIFYTSCVNFIGSKIWVFKK